MDIKIDRNKEILADALGLDGNKVDGFDKIMEEYLEENPNCSNWTLLEKALSLCDSKEEMVYMSYAVGFIAGNDEALSNTPGRDFINKFENN